MNLANIEIKPEDIQKGVPCIIYSGFDFLLSVTKDNIDAGM
jgi:hypothetical protein